VLTRTGGKGCNLQRLTAAGLSVPRWAVIDIDALQGFRRINSFDDPIQQALERLDAESAEEVATEIAHLFAAGSLDEALLKVIRDAYASVDTEHVAVRSSAEDEDGALASFAGQFATFLNVRGLTQVGERVRDCWASAYSARSLRYRLLHGLSVENIEMAVIVQAMVPAEKSGVMFTVNPVTRRSDELLISGAYGLGEGIVDGVVDADSLIVERASGAIKEVKIGSKEERLDAAAGGGVRSAAVADEARSTRSISDGEVAELVRCAREIEKLFGCPQDIEWAIGPDGLAVLQSRPITTTVDAAPGERRIWDNSNIIESFGDVTAPLTFSFARWAYRCVFADHARLIGVPARDHQALEQWLPNMLGYFDGRVYYNLLNWYRLVGLLPFYGAHRRILEVSLGISESIDDDLAQKLRPLQRSSRLAELAVRARIGARFAWHFATIELSVKRFLRHFYRMYGEFDPIDYSSLSAEEVYAEYRKAEAGLLSRWGRMVVLEAVLALSFGAMHALTTRWLPDAPESLVWEMAKVDSDVESAQPVERMREIAELVHADPELTALVARLPVGGEQAELRRAEGEGAAALRDALEGYLRDFGYRNANELKLEEPDLREDPALLFGMLRAALKQLELDGELARRDAAGEGGETYLRAHLRGPRLWVYKLVRRRVRRALRARESVRFCRTRTFGIARRMFRAIGEDMARFGALESARDVFYLRLDELLGAFNGTIAHRELKPLVALRKNLERDYREETTPARFTTEGTVYWGGFERAWAEAAAGAGGDWDGAQLSGVPCGPGVAEGEARVVDRPVDAEGRILVTYRTDPGWIGALASAPGLVIERGSPLTHVAVVARELGIPTVIQVPQVTERVRSGAQIRVDGGTGTVTIQEQAREPQGDPA
jgi:rifampicin phosphotransferase